MQIESIKASFRYDPETGEIFRKLPDGREKKASFYSKRQRRNRVTFKSKKMFSYRVAWLLHHGQWPDGEIDHINGDSADDRILNLRDVPRSVNQENIRKPTARNLLGILGVSKSGKKYAAMLTVDGVSTCLGLYETPENAHAAYLNAKRIHHAGCTI